MSLERPSDRAKARENEVSAEHGRTPFAEGTCSHRTRYNHKIKHMRSRHSSRQSKTFSAKRRARGISRIISVVGILCVVFLIIWGITSWSAFTITSVQISGVDKEEVSALHDKAVELLSGSYLGMFPRNNSLIYPRSAIRVAIEDAYREVKSVDVSRTDRHTITITINKKTPAALVCATLPDFDGNDLSLNDSGRCYFTDETGLIFKKAPLFSGAIYNRYYMPDLVSDVDVTASSSLIGIYATSTTEFSIMQRIYKAVQQSNITADAMLMKGGGEYELYVRNLDMSSSTAVIYFNTISPVAEQISNLISFWNHEVDAARAKRQQVGFDYIDVRYSPNVYHRFAR